MEGRQQRHLHLPLPRRRDGALPQPAGERQADDGVGGVQHEGAQQVLRPRRRLRPSQHPGERGYTMGKHLEERAPTVLATVVPCVDAVRHTRVAQPLEN